MLNASFIGEECRRVELGRDACRFQHAVHLRGVGSPIVGGWCLVKGLTIFREKHFTDDSKA